MPLSVVITEWALQSYVELVADNVFTREEYRKVLRTDVLRLKRYPDDHRFKLDTFWGPAKIRGGVAVTRGYKMKWHNIGPGKVQLRVCVAMINSTAFLCQAYVKGSDAKDKREAALLLGRIDLIEQGNFDYRGRL